MDDADNTPKGWSTTKEGFERRTKGGLQTIVFHPASGEYHVTQEGYTLPVAKAPTLEEAAKEADFTTELEHMKIRDLAPEDFADLIHNAVLMAFSGFIDPNDPKSIEKARARLGTVDLLVFELRSRLFDLAPEGFESKVERVCEDVRQGVYNAYRALNHGEYELGKHMATYAASAVGECLNDIEDAEKEDKANRKKAN